MAFKHSIKPLPFAYNALKGISEEVNKWHHDIHYAGYVNKRNEIEESLESVDKSKANANYSAYGEMKRRESFNASGQILHEIYWDNLGGDGSVDQSLELVQKIIADFGSMEKFLEDFNACSMASLGWCITCFDPSDGRIHNYICDFHNNGAVWGAVPLVAIDVFEHAYYREYGPKRADYLKAYLGNVDWKKVNSKFLKVK